MIEKLSNQSREIAEAFNRKPKDGIRMINSICEKRGVDPNVQIAEFFKSQKHNLNLEDVGDYLGTEGAQNQKVLEHFTKKMNFQGKDFVPAMRDFLQEFRLPREAQKIDRLVKSFAGEYVSQNPEPEQKITHDAAYVLAFQTIMLNTDLHNNSIKESDKMTLDGLKRNLRGTNNGKDFLPETLAGIYNDIKSKPFKLSFSKKIPGYVLSSSNLHNDKTYKAFSSNVVSNQDIQNLIPILSDREIETTVKRPNKFLGALTGMKTSITITDKETGAKVNVQTYKPSIFAQLFTKTQPTTIIQPIVEEGKEASKDSLKLASELAASFKTPPKSIEATYNYEKIDLAQSYATATNKIKQLNKQTHVNTVRSIRSRVESFVSNKPSSSIPTKPGSNRDITR